MNSQIITLLHKKKDIGVRRAGGRRISSQPRHSNNEENINGLEINVRKLLDTKKRIKLTNTLKEITTLPKLGDYTLNDLCKKFSTQFSNNSQLVKRINKGKKHFMGNRKSLLDKVELRNKLALFKRSTYFFNENAKGLYIGRVPYRKHTKELRFNLKNLIRKSKKRSKSQFIGIEQHNDLSGATVLVAKILKNSTKQLPESSILPNIKSVSNNFNEGSFKSTDQSETLYTNFKPITDGNIIIKTKNGMRI